jgi:hypothetical protein
MLVKRARDDGGQHHRRCPRSVQHPEDEAVGRVDVAVAGLAARGRSERVGHGADRGPRRRDQ